MMSSTRKIISDASVAERMICSLTCGTHSIWVSLMLPGQIMATCNLTRHYVPCLVKNSHQQCAVMEPEYKSKK